MIFVHKGAVKMTKYLVFKDGIHIATATSPEEADQLYAQWDADEIREFEDDGWLNMLSDE